MITVKFYLKKPKETKNTIHVRVRDGRRLDLTLALPEFVNLEDWDSASGSCYGVIQEFKNGKLITSRSGEAKERLLKNAKVNKALSDFSENILDSYKVSDKTKLDQEWLKKIIYPERFQEEDTKEPNLLECAYDYSLFKEQEFKKGKVKIAIVKKSKSIINLLERYFKHLQVSPPALTTIDVNFQRSFEDYCTDVEKYLPSYTNRIFKSIKTMVFHAAANGYKINDAIRHLKVKLDRKKFPILDFNELQLIEDYQFEQDHLDNARDWLIIGAMCGQRASDLLRFNVSMVEEEVVDGIKTYFVCFKQNKTGKTLRLALHSKIVRILEKRNWNFPRKISDQRFNEYIKEVGRLAGITEMVEGGISEKGSDGKVRKKFGVYPKHRLITSHICRRSFCTNFYSLIDTSVLMLASGHSTERQFREYIQDVDRKQAGMFAQALNSINHLNLN